MFATQAMGHSSHYKGLKKIEMDVLRNNEVIGSTNYFFEYDEDLFVVKIILILKWNYLVLKFFQY